MPPRLPAMRIASRVLRPRQPLVHRPYSTAPPPLPSPLQTRSLRIPLIAGALGFTTGLLFYTLSHSSTAEVRSSKTSSAHENRELTASASRKAGEEEGTTAANKAGGSPQDHKAARGVGYEKPEDGASGESRTGKVNGGHDESGQPKDERIRKAKSGEKSEKMKEEKKDGAEKKKEGESEGQDEGDEEQRGAVDPETGEINWDCPCLGDMPHGTCGAEFREAFSCFVKSDAEPKGEDCVDAFRSMQDCFRAHPEEYGPLNALDDDELDEESAEAMEAATQKVDEKAADKPASPPKTEKKDEKKEKKGKDSGTKEKAKST